MRLSSALVRRTVERFDSEPIPDDHPAVPKLNELFGNHTFFIAGSGLHIVEPADDGSDMATTHAGVVTKLASWKDARKTSLTPHEPEATDVIVDFDGEDLENDEDLGDLA